MKNKVSDTEFIALWRVAFGNEVVPIEAMEEFKEQIGVRDAMYLTILEEKYGEKSPFKRVDGIGWQLRE
jgi:hypothetical protein